MTQNPFQNPELLDDALAADLEATEAWRAENQPVEAALAAHGLIGTVRDITAHNETLHGHELGERLYQEFDNAFSAADTISGYAGGYAYNAPDYAATKELFTTAMKDWHTTGVLDKALEKQAELGLTYHLLITPSVEIRPPSFGVVVPKIISNHASFENHTFYTDHQATYERVVSDKARPLQISLAALSDKPILHDGNGTQPTLLQALTLLQSLQDAVPQGRYVDFYGKTILSPATQYADEGAVQSKPYIDISGNELQFAEDEFGQNVSDPATFSHVINYEPL